jgi:hypothetical protein
VKIVLEVVSSAKWSRPHWRQSGCGQHILQSGREQNLEELGH